MTKFTEKDLAINGGAKVKTTPYGTGQRYLDNELKYLKEALEQNTLFYGMGTQVKQACAQMATYTGMPYVVPCTSGSAAVHLGLIAAGIGPGDEVIVTPNTDAGSTIGIIEEGAVPIFCDPDFTLNTTAEAVAEKITPRTKAVVVIHLGGYPAPVDKIVELCSARGIAVVEDCAQSWGAKLNGQMVGTFGVAGCFSTNDFKHISTGDGGFVVLRDADLYRRVANYMDKCYDRLFDRTQTQEYFGINYRMSELQGAVARAQLEKVDGITSRRHTMGERLTEGIKAIPGTVLAQTIPGGYSTYWWTAMFVDETKFRVGRDQIVAAIQAEGISVSSYEKYDLIRAGLFQNRTVRPWLQGNLVSYPFTQPDGREYYYSYDATPRHRKMLDTGIQIWLQTFFTDQDIEDTIQGMTKVFSAYAK